MAVLVPARDEGARIGRVLAEVREVLPAARLLVVDGASRDATRSIARSAGAEVVVEEGRGYAAALATGYRHLAGASAVVQLDADGQHPPREIPRLVAALDQADWVIGRRVHGWRGAALRRAGAAVLSLAVARHTGVWPADPTSGFQCLGPRTLAAFCRWFPDDVADANVRVWALRLGLRVVEVPVEMAPRSGGRSMHDGWRGALHLGQSLAAVRREAHRPLVEVPA